MTTPGFVAKVIPLDFASFNGPKQALARTAEKAVTLEQQGAKLYKNLQDALGEGADSLLIPLGSHLVASIERVILRNENCLSVTLLQQTPAVNQIPTTLITEKFTLTRKGKLSSAVNSPINEEHTSRHHLSAIENGLQATLHMPAVAMWTHGYHQLMHKLELGRMDTGGQNKYVEDFCEALRTIGARTLVYNRESRYEEHDPQTHQKASRFHAGWEYTSDGLHGVVRISDGTNQFIRKEDLTDQNLSALADGVARELKAHKVGIVVSHYWDGYVVMNKALDILEKEGSKRIPHVWVPHSLGELKKCNLTVENENKISKMGSGAESTTARNKALRLLIEKFEDLKIDRRIEVEKEMLEKWPPVTVISTSQPIHDFLVHNYNVPKEKIRWLVPGVDPKILNTSLRVDVRTDSEFLSKISSKIGWQIDDLLHTSTSVMVEISRTDETKCKEKILEAFKMLCDDYRVKNNAPRAPYVLIINADDSPYGKTLKSFVEDPKNGINANVALFNKVTEDDKCKAMALSRFCISMSKMEGWGMSWVEGVASGALGMYPAGMPAGDNRFLGDVAHVRSFQSIFGGSFSIGQAGVRIEAGETTALAGAMQHFLNADGAQEHRILEEAKKNVRDLSWDCLVRALFKDLEILSPDQKNIALPAVSKVA